MIKRFWVWALVVAALLSVEIIVFIYKFQPDILVGDHWGYYTPLFDQASLWEGFSFQQGSHFLGLGFIISKIIGPFFSYSVAGESFVVWILMLVNATLALSLKKRIFGELVFADLLIIPIFLYTGYSEIYTLLAYSAVVALPLCSILILGHVTLEKNLKKKAVYLLILFFFSIFTGYAFITAGLILVYTLYVLYSHTNSKAVWISLGFQVFLLALFILKYRVPQASICVLKDQSPPYMEYGFTLLLNFFDGEIRKRDIVIIGLGLLLPFVFVLKNMEKQKRNFFPLLLLLFFSGGYFVLNCFSRACMGVETALAPRYSVFLIPGFLAYYFFLNYYLDLKTRKGILIIGFMFSSVYFLRYEQHSIMYTRMADKKVRIENWVNCYEQKRSSEVCNGEDMQVPFSVTQYSKIDYFMSEYRLLKTKAEVK